MSSGDGPRYYACERVVRRLAKHFPYFVFFNSDIMPQQLYLYHTGLFPLAYGEYAVGRTGGSPAGTCRKARMTWTTASLR